MKLLSVRASATLMAVLMATACSASEDENAALGSDPVVAAEAQAAAETAVDAVAEQVVFPEAFRGNWDFNEDGCRDADTGTRFVISDTQTKGYESTATVQSVEPVDDLSIRVELNEESAEGTRVVKQTMHLSPVAGISMRIVMDDKTIRALRCDPV